jgi:PAS domain-containing protein
VASGVGFISRLVRGRRAGRISRPPDPRLVLDALLDSTPAPVTVWNDHGIVCHANQAARELLGRFAVPGAAVEAWMRDLSPRTLSGLPMPLEDIPALRALQGESPSQIDMRVTLGYIELLLDVSAKPVFDQQSRPRGAVMWCDAVDDESPDRRRRW